VKSNLARIRAAKSQEELIVETYPVDIAPEQIVRWLMAEGRLHAFDLLVSATRSLAPGELTSGESLAKRSARR
jgi:hypothetical protein